MTAFAAPVITYQDGQATGIQDLEVNGLSYDVAFVFGSYNSVFADHAPTFLNNERDAYTANSAMMQLFQSEGAVTIGSSIRQGLLLTPIQYQTQDDRYPGYAVMRQFGYEARTDGNWQHWGNLSLLRDIDYTNYNYAFAVYTPHVSAVPEPSTMALIGLGLAGLAFTQRKKIKTVHA